MCVPSIALSEDAEMSGGGIWANIGDGSILERERSNDGAYGRWLNDIGATDDELVVDPNKAERIRGAGLFQIAWAGRNAWGG